MFGGPFYFFRGYHEAYFSAQQSRARPSPRFLRPQEDCRRPQGPPRSSCTRSQEAKRLSSTADKPPRPAVIGQRKDFLAANHGLRVARPAFVLLAHPNAEQGKRYGITVTKRIGNAVVRNRVKRRFRELLWDALPGEGLSDHDHVLIARDGAIGRDFGKMRAELSAALERARDGKGDPPRRKGSRRPRASRPKGGNRR